MDSAALLAEVQAGRGPQLIRDLEPLGLVFDSRLGVIDFMKAQSARHLRVRRGPQDDRVTWPVLVCDAQPELVTVTSSGFPAYLTNILDPNWIDVAFTPMKAAQIMGGEVQKGNWLTNTNTFKVRELTGTVATYGDFNTNGNSGANVNFPATQSYHYQVMAQWGEKEAAEAGLAAIDWASSQHEAAALALNKFQNKSYFYGIAGQATYGLLNHPNLPAPIVATSQWNLAGTTAEVIYEDIRRMFVQIQIQSKGTIDAFAPMTLVVSNEIQLAFNKANSFGMTVYKYLKENFPNITFENAVEYNTGSAAGGQLVQLIVKSVNGQRTVFPGYTEKLRSHNMEVRTSSYAQKKSQGTWGTVLVYSYAIAQMTGV